MGPVTFEVFVHKMMAHMGRGPQKYVRGRARPLCPHWLLDWVGDGRGVSVMGGNSTGCPMNFTTKLTLMAFYRRFTPPAESNY